MTVGEILKDVRTRMPNAFTDAELLVWLDTAVRELYKVLALREGYTFSARGGEKLLPLPGDIRPDLISAVLVNGKKREAGRIGDAARRGMWYRAMEGFIGLCPPPPHDAEITVWYFLRPARLLSPEEAEREGVDFAAQEIRLDEDYIELIKCALLCTVAEAREDVALANNYKLNYNLLLARARQERYEKDGKYPTTKIIGKKRCGR